MNTCTEDSSEPLECLFQSLPGDPSSDIDRRLEALEQLVETQARKLDDDILTRLHTLEDLLHLQIAGTRKDIAREATERREQFAVLAAKISRKIDRLHRTAADLEEQQTATAHSGEAAE